MRRIPYIVGCITLTVLLAAGASGEIVKVAAERARFYDAETKEIRTYKAKGKRFMVYGVDKEWYLVDATIKGQRKLVWLAKADVAIDWAEAKTARVASVVNTNTLKLSTGELVQFAGIVVTNQDTAVTRRTLDWLRRALEGRTVTLEFDEKLARPAQGGSAAYVYIGGMFINRTLIEYGLAAVPEGYATAGGRYAPVFGYYAEQARVAHRGAWRAEQGDTRTASGQGAGDRVPVLTHAQLVQWGLRLQVKVTIRTERLKTDDGGKEVCFTGPGTTSQGSRPSREVLAAIITAS